MLKGKKPCSYPACPNLVTIGTRYCVTHTHEGKERTVKAKQYNSLYNTTRWRKVRRLYLQQNPYCEYCKEEGRIKAATCIDHRMAHKGNEELFWDQDNWVPSCDDHNRIKNAKHEGGFGNKIKEG